MRTASETSIGERARAARVRLGLNQSEVAERVGISNEVYGRFERGSVTPRLKTLLKVCDVLRVTPNDLLLGAEPSPTLAGPSPLTGDLLRLVAVLDKASTITIRRVTEVARWLQAGESDGSPASRTSERAVPPSRGRSKRSTKPRR